MSSPRKKWDEHSTRWKREQTQKGLSKSKWDSWFRLSEKSKKVADPYKYAAGMSVAEQRITKAKSAALANMLKHFPQARMGTVQLGIEEMTSEQLRWTAKATAAQIRRRAGAKVQPGTRNPWWYN
jgi:hypothetical protein